MRGIDATLGDPCDFRPAPGGTGFLPISPMNHLIKAMAPLKGFPSEKILKDLKPARGMVITTSIHVPPGDRTVLQQMEEGSCTDPKAWKGGKDLVDASPIIARIAEEMGYDPKLLAEGEGETHDVRAQRVQAVLVCLRGNGAGALGVGHGNLVPRCAALGA